MVLEPPMPFSSISIESQSSTKPKQNYQRNTKYLIRKACLQVLDNPKSSPNAILKAAAILERLQRIKGLAAKKRNRKRQNADGARINELLERAS